MVLVLVLVLASSLLVLRVVCVFRRRCCCCHRHGDTTAGQKRSAIGSVGRGKGVEERRFSPHAVLRSCFLTPIFSTQSKSLSLSATAIDERAGRHVGEGGLARYAYGRGHRVRERTAMADEQTVSEEH